MALITISRGSFAGGRAVATLLGERLKQPVLSREEVFSRAAKDYGISEKELTSSLNHPPSFWQQVPGKRIAYINTLTAVLLDEASKGHLIYHGYVGHMLFPGISHILRVRVIADMEYRIEAAMTAAKLSRKEAISYIRQRDNERRQWAKLIYGVNWEDPAQYHVVLNLSQLSPASAAETIARMSELPDFQPTEESKQRFDDLRLSCRVWGALASNPETRGSGIQITAERGRVLITGNIGSGKALELVPKIAEQVSGVAAVHCEAGVGTDWSW